MAATSVFGEFQANGVLGFAPSNDERSIVKQMFASGQISKQMVSFNYENPLDMN